jgi:dienelactone hydrolase
MRIMIRGSIRPVVGPVWMAALAAVLLAAGSAIAHAQVATRPIAEQGRGGRVAGRLAFDPEAGGPRRPAVLLLDDDATRSRRQSARLAEIGYAVLVPETTKGKSDDTADRLAQATAALEVLGRQSTVDRERVLAIGHDAWAPVALELVTRGTPGLIGAACVGDGLDAAPAVAATKTTGRRVLLVTDRGKPPGALTTALERAGIEWKTVPGEAQAAEPSQPKGRLPGPLSRNRDNSNDNAAKAGPNGEDDPYPWLLPWIVGIKPVTLPRGVPDKVRPILEHVDLFETALIGYEGGRTFQNLERNLPRTDRGGRKINFREWDVNPLRQGVNRGAERMVTGSDGSAYFTGDHYRTFIRIR